MFQTIGSVRPIVCRIMIAVIIGSVSACSFLPTLSKTPGEQESTYTYIPIDPLATSASLVDVCPVGYKITPYISLLPDEAVRIGITTTDASGNVSVGSVGSVGAQGNTYTVTMDYISVDTKPMPTYVTVDNSASSAAIDKGAGSIQQKTTYTIVKDPISTVWSSYDPSTSRAFTPPADSRLIDFPVYVGVGLRLTANITVRKGTLNLTSLGAISASVSAGDSSGSLTVEVIGISGPKISNLFPFVTDLNQTTIQNALVALGSIKAVLYDSTTNVVPRVVGFENPIGGGPDAVNQVISILASDRLNVDEACTQTAAGAPPAGGGGGAPGGAGGGAPGGAGAAGATGSPASNSAGQVGSKVHAKPGKVPKKGNKVQAAPARQQ